MIPKKLSNDLCSLNPNTDKLTFSFIFTFDKDGKIINQEFKKGIINSKYKLTYDEVQVVIEGGEARDEELKNSILVLDKYAKILRKNRFKNDTLNFGTSEVKFKLDENNKPVDIFFKEQKDANWLIEEFMILTNTKVCEFIASKGLKSIHRTHDKPDIEKLNSLKSFVESMGYSLNLKDEENIKTELNNLLKQASKTPEENIINNLVVRCMAKANYQTLNVHHYGLSLEHYVHTTSPIRRACDLLIHRQLDEIINKNKTDIKGFYEGLDAISSRISSREKIAQKAERESVKYMQALYLSDKIGKIYKGIVSSITDYGMFIDIPENGCNGFIKLSNIEGDRYTADVQNYCIKGSFGQSIRLGDEVNVVVSAVDVASKFINLSLVNL
jgi:ribonuclease R